MDKEAIGKLAQEAAQGSQDAFQQLYQLTKQRAYFVAISITKNEADAQDIVQESYLKAFRNLGQLEQPESFGGWLARITANSAKNYISRKQPASFAEYGDESGQDWQEETDRDFLPDERLDLDETKRVIAGLVGELPEDQRLCVLLHYFDEMEVGAIAQTLSIPEGTVKSRLSRARVKLLGMLEQAQAKGLKLYGLAPIPLLWYLLKLLAQDTAEASDRLPPLVFGAAAATAAAAAGTAAAAGSAAGASSSGGTGAGAAVFAAGALPKVIAAVAAAGLVVGGTAVGITVAKRSADKHAAATTGSSFSFQYDETASAMETSEGEVTFPDWMLPESTVIGGDTQPGWPVASMPQNSVPPNGTRQNSSEARTSAAENSGGTGGIASDPAPQSSAQANSSNPATTQQATSTRQSTAQRTTAPPQSFTSAQTMTQPPTQAPTNGATQPSATTAATTQTNAPGTTQSQPTTAPTQEVFEFSNGSVTKYLGNESVVTIPATITGAPVMSVGSWAFMMNQTVQEVHVAEGIERIGLSAFIGCTSLERVTIPKSVTSIDPLAFSASPKVKIYAYKGSYADTFAHENNIVIVYL